MGNSFVMKACDNERESMLWVVKELLLFRLNYKEDCSKTVYILLYYVKRTSALGAVEKEASCSCLRFRTTDEADNSAVAGRRLSRRTERNVGEWFGVELFREIRRLMHVVRGNYGIPFLSRSLPYPYHCFCINWFYTGDFENQVNIQSNV